MWRLRIAVHELAWFVVKEQIGNCLSKMAPSDHIAP